MPESAKKGTEQMKPLKQRYDPKEKTITVYADFDFKILCPKAFETPGENGTKRLEDCRECPFWREYGSEGERTIVTDTGDLKQEPIHTVSCVYSIADADTLKRYSDINTLEREVNRQLSEKTDG